MQGRRVNQPTYRKHFPIQQEYIKLNSLDLRVDYWRTHTAIEVDFVVNFRTMNPVPIEVKISSKIHNPELKGVKTFMKEFGIKRSYIVCMVDKKQRLEIGEGEIVIYPVQEFLQDLWAGKIISSN